MKVKQLEQILKDRFSEMRAKFLLQVFNNKYSKDNNILLRLLDRSDNMEHFENLIKQSRDARLTQFAGELLKYDREFVESFATSSDFVITSSDAGGVKIGNESFRVIVPNGYGDTDENIVAIIKESDAFNNSAFEFWSTIEGENINIYDYDCGDTVVMKLPKGRYGIYYNDRVIILQKWD